MADDRFRWFRVFILPGAVFQSVLVGGGYGTGREVVEFFTQHGPVGGFLGIGLTLLIWTVVLGLTYDFARRFRAYDYRTFFRSLLGRGWIAFEALFLIMLILVLAVVASAAASVLEQEVGLPPLLGTGVMLVLVAGLAFFGRTIIARSLAIWTGVLYVLFLAYFFASTNAFGAESLAALNQGGVGDGWALGGFQYALYNLFIVPVVLYSATAIRSAREAWLAGCIAALICLAPAALFHFSFLSQYPEVIGLEIPVYSILGLVGLQALVLAYVVGIFGTFVETGAGMIHGVNERIDSYLRDRSLPTLTARRRSAIAFVAVAMSAALATIGIIPLIARGYGTIAWGFLLVYIVPLLTLGVAKIRRHAAAEHTRGLSKAQLAETDSAAVR
jgi:uncharacterized membrane protein YkvI